MYLTICQPTSSISASTHSDTTPPFRETIAQYSDLNMPSPPPVYSLHITTTKAAHTSAPIVASLCYKLSSPKEKLLYGKRCGEKKSEKIFGTNEKWKKPWASPHHRSPASRRATTVADIRHILVCDGHPHSLNSSYGYSNGKDSHFKLKLQIFL